MFTSQNFRLSPGGRRAIAYIGIGISVGIILITIILTMAKLSSANAASGCSPARATAEDWVRCSFSGPPPAAAKTPARKKRRYARPAPAKTVKKAAVAPAKPSAEKPPARKVEPRPVQVIVVPRSNDIHRDPPVVHKLFTDRPTDKPVIELVKVAPAIRSPCRPFWAVWRYQDARCNTRDP